jgi:hypothetical protein
MRRLIAVATLLALFCMPVAPALARAFNSKSYWNTPLDAHGIAPVDPHSAEYIRDSMDASHTRNYLNLVASDWSTPVYYPHRSDPSYTITPLNHSTRSVTLHIPAWAQSPVRNTVIVFDAATNQAVGLWNASYSGGQWQADGFDRYYLDSQGLAEKVGGRKGNVGHRGIPAAERVVRERELRAKAIRHRLSCYWWGTGVKYANHYFPMYEDEGDQGGIVPEGITVRIRRSVHLKALGLRHAALTIARAIKRYGCVVGDNSGSGNNLKIQAGVVIAKDALAAIPWSKYQFVKGGYNPATGHVNAPSPGPAKLQPPPIDLGEALVDDINAMSWIGLTSPR